MSALNCEAYNTFSTVVFDLSFATAKLRLSLRQSNKKSRCDWIKVLTDNNIKELYTAEIKNRFQALQDLDENARDSNTTISIQIQHNVYSNTTVSIPT